MSAKETLVGWWRRCWTGANVAEVLERLEEADRDYATHAVVCNAMVESAANSDRLRTELEARLRTLGNAAMAHAAERDAARKECATLRKDVEHFSQQAGAAHAARERDHLRALKDRDTLRRERDSALADWDSVRKEMDELRRRLHAEKELVRSLRLRMVDAPSPLTRPEPTRLEVAARVAGGMTCEVHWDDALVLRQCADAAWVLAGELLAKARREDAPGAQEPLTNGKAGKA